MKYALMAVLVFGLAVPSMAVLGLPIAEEATSEAGAIRASAGVTLESDINLYGARITYGATDDISLFGGVGLIDWDDADTDPYLQIGGKYRIPIQDLPFDLAARVAFGITNLSDSYRDQWGSYSVDIDIWTLNVGLLASKQLDPVIVYGLLGMSYMKMEIKGTVSGPGFRESVSFSDSETEPAIAGGVIYPVNEQFSLYAELAHIDELFASLGARFRF